MLQVGVAATGGARHSERCGLNMVVPAGHPDIVVHNVITITEGTKGKRTGRNTEYFQLSPRTLLAHG